MATNIYESCTNPITGESFKALLFDKNAFIMQWTLQANGYVPFEHIHLHQDEIFHIKKGELRIVMNGKDHIVKEGESFTVPKGVAHLAYNNKEEVLDSIVEYVPALDHNLLMQCLCGLTNDGYIDKKGSISIPRMGYFLKKMKAQCMARPTEIPAPVFNIALYFFYIRGVLSGWKSLFSKYIDN